MRLGSDRKVSTRSLGLRTPQMLARNFYFSQRIFFDSAHTSPYNEPMALLWSLLVIDPLIVLSTMFFGAISLVQSLFDKSGNSMIATARVWARTLVAFARVRVTVEGLEKIDPKGAYVFAANHLSYM